MLVSAQNQRIIAKSPGFEVVCDLKFLALVNNT